MPLPSRDGPITVLLVEDNPGDVRLIQEAFGESAVELSFHVAADGREALEFLRDSQREGGPGYPDLVLLDLNLPRLDGFSVLEALRDEAEFPPLPVIVLTSSKSQEDVLKSYEHSANAYLTKPRDPGEFAALARTVEDFWMETARLPPVPA